MGIEGANQSICLRPQRIDAMGSSPERIIFYSRKKEVSAMKESEKMNPTGTEHESGP